jgi:hypothetical protein
MTSALDLAPPLPTGLRVRRVRDGYRVGLLEVRSDADLQSDEKKGPVVLLASPRSKLLFGALVGDPPGDIYGWIDPPLPPLPALAAHAAACASPRADACRVNVFEMAAASDSATRAFARWVARALAEEVAKDPKLVRASLEALRSGQPAAAALAVDVLYLTDVVVDREPLWALLFGPGAADAETRYHALDILVRRNDLNADDVHAIARILAEPVGDERWGQSMLDLTACRFLVTRLGPDDHWAVSLIAAMPGKWPTERGLMMFCAQALARVLPTAGPSSAPSRTPPDKGSGRASEGAPR